MLDGKKFDPEEMTGQTEMDWKKIEKAMADGFLLYVDKYMRVVADSALYIANAVKVGPGKGIVYRKEYKSMIIEEFDTDTMNGQTRKYREAILKALSEGKILYIDDHLDITTENGEYVAKGNIIAPGFGIKHTQ